MERANLDYANLPFAYQKTDANIRYWFRDGKWSAGELTADEYIPLHMAATCLHYGQEVFEGLKAYGVAPAGWLNASAALIAVAPPRVAPRWPRPIGGEIRPSPLSQRARRGRGGPA